MHEKKWLMGNSEFTLSLIVLLIFFYQSVSKTLCRKSLDKAMRFSISASQRICDPAIRAKHFLMAKHWQQPKTENKLATHLDDSEPRYD